ncbi:aldehyde dehydrogenase family protein [Colwellia sp. TT2012]|uniref:aldehyde dehydrogenase family protein n=1 Tax=Colwellia sp. TT2012 TaxID=1720342 RepID=UPI000710E80E|nr:aldehyde dehydrogenase family protein [Colwellia sp. TT2012]
MSWPFAQQKQRIKVRLLLWPMVLTMAYPLIYSQNSNRICRVSQQLAFGMVGINDGFIANSAAPFAGIKQSGYRREAHKYGLEDIYR